MITIHDDNYWGLFNMMIIIIISDNHIIIIFYENKNENGNNIDLWKIRIHNSLNQKIFLFWIIFLILIIFLKF